jgi:hypothetical protein
MKHTTVETYRKDKLYPKVVKAAAFLLRTSDEICPLTILLQMGRISSKDHESWRRGQIPYLERVFQGSLSKANRILKIIGFHAHDLKMVPILQTYRQPGSNRCLRFSRSGESKIERSYSRHFRWNQSQTKKQELIEKIMSEPIHSCDALPATCIMDDFKITNKITEVVASQNIQ